MSPGVRKIALTAHVCVSVAWIGAVASFLALAIVGLANQDASQERVVYVAMELISWTVIVPLSFASTITGIIQSLGTSWGLFRHYWVLIKVLMTIPSTIVLLIHMRPIGHLAAAASSGGLGVDLDRLRLQLVVAAGAALLVLVATTVLSVYKPRGATRFGVRTDTPAT